MSEKTRKAVVTTAQVQAALDGYTKVFADLSGTDVEKLEFDKGARGKGFAVYTPEGEVKASYETKEEALDFYNNWVTVANEVVTLQNFKAKDPVKAPRKVAAKVAEVSQEGDKPAESNAA